MSRSSRVLDVIGVVEACYRVDLEEKAWLAGVVEAARPFFGPDTSGYLYDASSGTQVEVKASCVAPSVDLPAFMRLLASAPPEFVRDSWASRRVAYATDIDGFDEALAAKLHELGGATDVLAVNGLDPTAQGFWLGAPLTGRVVKSKRKLALLERVSTHLTSGYRMRRVLAQASASPELRGDAVLRPDGTVDHAAGEAREREARDALRRAVVGIERARSRSGRRDPETAIAGWRGLVSARWTLLDEFDRDGARYVVARKNPVTTGKVGTLSGREIEVLSWALLGHDNKVIAYELGISHQTVRVFLHRAAAKLGAPNRRALLEKFAALKLKPPKPPKPV